MKPESFNLLKFCTEAYLFPLSLHMVPMEPLYTINPTILRTPKSDMMHFTYWIQVGLFCALCTVTAQMQAALD